MTMRSSTPPRHGEPQPVVVDDVVELGDEADAGRSLAACPMKNSVIASPSAILDDVLFQVRPAFSGSGLEEEFHLHPGELDDVVVLERVRLRRRSAGR